ncbi:increased DNA methylation 3 [Mercurialis annua]|uniref:increased DNA methylation 3 n=1 Tax=Mercurialis annua TaxID=3986 RepID=UPI00215E2E23|nr:increased DNA methylation 3 [Mercurialis annua]
MDNKMNDPSFREPSKESFSNQHFLVNFIMSNYLGPDVFSDYPRRSAFQRLAARLPPYTLNHLGNSFLSFCQLESIYYYVLRNAHPSLVWEPTMLYMYLKGNLCLPSSGPLEDPRQFTRFFPLNFHGHKRYAENHEVVKGIVLIEDPDTSYIKEEDLERFKCLSGLGDLRIDVKKCLNYRHDPQKSGEETEPMHRTNREKDVDEVKSGEETEPMCVTNREKDLAEVKSERIERSPTMFQKTYRRRSRCDPTTSTLLNNLSIPEQHNNESISSGLSNNMDGPVTMPITTVKMQDYPSKKWIVLTGSARKGRAGPQVGAVDIGISRSAYFFQVALPGVRTDFCEFSCEIEWNGKVVIQGTVSGGETIKKRSRVFQMKYRRLCPAGPFTVSFNLPGPVDPRFFSPKFRNDGIFEAVVVKHNGSDNN